MRNLLAVVVGIHLHIMVRAALFDNTSTNHQSSRMDMMGPSATSAATTGTLWGTAGTSWGAATSTTQGTQHGGAMIGTGTGGGRQYNSGAGVMIPSNGQAASPVRGTVTGAVLGGSRIFGSPGNNAPLLPGPSAPRACAIDISLRCNLGSSTGVSCESLQPRNTNCQVMAVYSMDICNVGGVQMRVNAASLDHVGAGTATLLPLLGNNNGVAVGACAQVEDTRILNVCTNTQYRTEAYVQGIPPSGSVCEDREQLIFSSAYLAPPPAPYPVAPPAPYPVPVPSAPYPVPVPPAPYPMPVPRPVPGPPQMDCRMDVSLKCGLGSARGPDCSTLAPRNTNCQVTAVYTMQICNTGGVDMQLTLANLDPAVGPVVNVLPLFHLNRVPPRSCAPLEDVRTINVCRNVSYRTRVFARANPPNGRYCEDQDEVLFRSAQLIPPPVPVPFPVPAPYPVPFPVPAPYPVPFPVPAPYPVPFPVPAPYPVPVPAPYPVPVPVVPPRPYFPPPPLAVQRPPLAVQRPPPPLVYHQPPLVYQPPPLVYRQPPPLVYQQPARTYYQPPPVYNDYGCGNGKSKGYFGGRNCGCGSGKGKGRRGGCGGKGGKGKGGKRGRTSSLSYEVLASAAGTTTSFYTIVTGMMCLLFFSLF